MRSQTIVLRPVAIPRREHSDAGEALCALRLGAELQRRDAAKATGLTTRQVADLEAGRCTFASSDDRAQYIAALIVGGGDG